MVVFDSVTRLVKATFRILYCNFSALTVQTENYFTDSRRSLLSISSLRYSVQRCSACVLRLRYYFYNIDKEKRKVFLLDT